MDSKAPGEGIDGMGDRRKYAMAHLSREIADPSSYAIGPIIPSKSGSSFSEGRIRPVLLKVMSDKEGVS